MSIRLQGGMESTTFWCDVQQIGIDLLRQNNFADWEVTIRPFISSDAEYGAVDEACEMRLYHDLDKQEITLAISIGQPHDCSPRDFAQLEIIDFIEQLLEADDGDGDDADV